MNGDRVSTLIGFLAAGLVLWVVVSVIGVADVVEAMGDADVRILLGLVFVAAFWISCWGMSLHTVLGAVGAPVAPHQAIMVFSAAVFSNNVTPFGQAGGEPISALMISSVADSEYERGLAAIASVDTIHFVPSIGLATVGFGFVVLSAAQLTRNLIFAALAVVALALVVPVGAYVGWRHRYGIEAALLRALAPVIRWFAKLLPGRKPPTRDSLADRIEGFFDAVSRVARDPKSLVTAMAFSALGWIALATSLWLSLYAIGWTVPFPATLFVVPVGSIAGVTPLPGGTGSLEAAFIALLVPVAGVPASVATAAVLIHRGATYLLPTIVGGGFAAIIGTEHKRQEG
ncbi:lysylphosphatidylglycerol synthase transmembrane domain-containing protein [Halobacteriales archaeon Cl-PHB]